MIAKFTINNSTFYFYETEVSMKFVIFQGKNKDEEQSWYWRLLAANGANIAVGGEGFSKYNAIDAVKNVRNEVNAETPIVEDGSEQEQGDKTRFCWYVGDDGQWYWKLQNKRNNQTIAIGGEGFSSKQSVIDSIKNACVVINRHPDYEFENPEDDPAYDVKGMDDTPTHGRPGS